MKKLRWLIILLLVSYNSISQTVILDSIQAQAVIKDLISGDLAKEENKLLKRTIENLNQQVQLENDKNFDLQLINGNLELALREKDTIIENNKIMCQSDIKKEKKKSFWLLCSTGFFALTTAILTLK